MIYLDNGATTFPKPKEVADAVYDYILNVGSNINRGGYEKAYSAAEVVLETRSLLSKMMNGYGPRCSIFTPGNTYALNFAIKGLARKGDRFVTSGMEHNAVYRPLHQLSEQGLITVDYMPCNKDGELILEEALEMIDEGVRAVVMLHASNVSGTLMPLREIGARCREKGVIFIVDAAQSAGVVPIDMKECGISVLTLPGHKSLLGPSGLGVMMIDPAIAGEMVPLVAGGTGSHSDMAEMPPELPDRFESGTLNLPGIFGLNAALKWLNEHIEEVRAHEERITARFIEGLSDILVDDSVMASGGKAVPDGKRTVRLAGLKTAEGRVGVISLDFLNGDNGMIAFQLEQEYGIMTRVGLHCAPLAHRSLGTFPEGTVRFSIGPFTTNEEIDTAVAAIHAMAE